jgi:hypothetical protein
MRKDCKAEATSLDNKLDNNCLLFRVHGFDWTAKLVGKATHRLITNFLYHYQRRFLLESRQRRQPCYYPQPGMMQPKMLLRYGQGKCKV